MSSRAHRQAKHAKMGCGLCRFGCWSGLLERSRYSTYGGSEVNVEEIGGEEKKGQVEIREERVVGDRARGRGGKDPAANEASCFRENDQRSSKISTLAFHAIPSFAEHSSFALHIYSSYRLACPDILRWRHGE